MNYTLHQLQIFVEVVKHGSVTEAAKEINISQPALSIQLKNFQDQFDQPLTEIHSRKLHVTDFGHSIAEIAKSVLREAEAIKYKTKEYDDLLAGKLKISSASTGKYVMPYFMNGFHEEHPGVDLILDVTNKTNVIEDLKNNLVDFAWVSTVPEDIDVHEEIMMENKLYLVGNTNTFDKNASLIYREKGSATRAAMDNYFKETGRRKRIELTSNEAVKQAVIAGLGYSVLPLIGIRNEIMNQQLHIIPRAHLPITTQWRMIWLKKKNLSRVAEKYLEWVSEHKKEIIQNKFQWYLDKADQLG
ncbi:LysR substrate-binding domain-containing protein [Balneola sp. MJW-20]|uniref:LysR substrate-binding domain-containing protein n=1 Tax=Gracilimonas aurantiaca TaxID=3234185 RepID=UPI003467D9BA